MLYTNACLVLIPGVKVWERNERPGSISWSVYDNCPVLWSNCFRFCCCSAVLKWVLYFFRKDFSAALVSPKFSTSWFNQVQREWLRSPFMNHWVLHVPRSLLVIQPCSGVWLSHMMSPASKRWIHWGSWFPGITGWRPSLTDQEWLVSFHYSHIQCIHPNAAYLYMYVS